MTALAPRRPERAGDPLTEPPGRASVRHDPMASGWWTAGWITIIGAHLIFALAWLGGAPTGRGLIVGPLVVALALPAIVRLREREARFDLGGIVLTGLGVKLLAVSARFWMVEQLYGGVGDSTEYDQYGRAFAPLFRSLEFDVDPERPFPGTGFLRVLTGVIYAVFGADKFTGYIVFAMLAFTGAWFFHRAFVTAVPDGAHRRYALLVFFWPSLLFWPASIGKESWMIFALGLTSAGAAAAYARRPHGFALLGLGIVASAMPRPHIAIVVLAAVGVGFVMATMFGARAGGSSVGFGTKVVAMVFLAVASSLLAPRVATFLNIDDLDGTGFSESLAEVNRRTSQGGSGFTAPEITSPTDYPWAITTVLFRPFPFEVDSVATIISALEGLLLLSLLGVSVPRLVRLPIELMRNAYAAYAAAFAFMFVYVFSFVGNFGILARQRVQLLPFLFVLLALPAAAKRRPPRLHERSPHGSVEPDASGVEEQIGRGEAGSAARHTAASTGRRASPR